MLHLEQGANMKAGKFAIAAICLMAPALLPGNLSTAARAQGGLVPGGGPDPAVFGAASIVTGLQASIPAVPFSGCSVLGGGSSYTSPSATITGNSYLGGTKGGSISFTVSGGVITGCTASGGSWTGGPAVAISDSTGSGAVVYPVVSLQTLNVSAGTLNVNGAAVVVPSTSFTLTAAGAGSFGTYCISVNITTGVWNAAQQAISSGCPTVANSQTVMTVTTSAWFGGEPATNNDIIAVNYFMKRAGQSNFDFLNTSKDFPVQTASFITLHTLPGPFAAPNVCALGVPGQNWGCQFNGNYWEWFSEDIQPITGTNILDAGPVLAFQRVSQARTQQSGDLLLTINSGAETGNGSGEIGYGQILNRIVSVGTSGNNYNDAKGLWWFSTVGPDSLQQEVPRFEIGSGLYAGNENVGTVAHCGQFTSPSGCVALTDMGAGTINLPGSIASNDFGNADGYYLDNKIAFQTSQWTLYGSTSGSNHFNSDQNGTVGLGTSSPYAQSAWTNSLVVAAAQNSTTGLLVYDADIGASVAAAIGLKTNTTNSFLQLGLNDGSGTPTATMAAGNGTLSIPIIYKFGQYDWESVGGTQWAILANGVFSLGAAGAVTGGLQFFNSTSGSITLQPPSGALGAQTLTVPDATDTLVGRATTDTLTNKTISGASNTLANIGNASLTNSSTTVAGQTCTLGNVCGLADFSAKLGSNVALSSAGTFVDIISVAQGSSGTWWATVNIENAESAGDILTCKLWDGSTVFNSLAAGSSTNFDHFSMSGIITSPSGNIKLTCKSNNGDITIYNNASGLANDTNLTVVRLN
jgi:hypothetical protein